VQPRPLSARLPRHIARRRAAKILQGSGPHKAAKISRPSGRRKAVRELPASDLPRAARVSLVKAPPPNGQRKANSAVF
jgi:hypothetical protein